MTALRQTVCMAAMWAELAFTARAADWTMFGHDPQRTGWAMEETTISPTNVSNLALQWKAKLKNEAYSLSALTAPVVASNVSTVRGVRSVVYVAGITYLTTHLVADLEHTTGFKADYDAVVAAGLALPVGVGRALGQIRAQINAAPSTRDRVQVAYSEWMFRSPAESRLPNFDNMGGAVIAAAWLNMLALHADWIPIANMTGLVEFGGIYKRRGRTYVTPQYWALYLYSKYAGDTVIGTETRVAQYDVHHGQSFAPEIPGVPYLDVLGTANSTGGDVSLFVVNRSPKSSQPASIRLTGFTPASEVKVLTLAAPSLVDKNDEEHQNAVRPVESHEVMEGATLHHVFPVGSVTVFLFAGRRKG